MRKYFFQLGVLLSLVSVVFMVGTFARAQTVDELQQKIATQNAAIQKLEDEIKQYQGSLANLATKKKTLSTAIAQLAATQKALETQIKLTQAKVDTTNLNIRQISSDISYKQDEIAARAAALKEALLTIYESDGKSLVQVALSDESFSQFWNDVEDLGQFSATVNDNVEVIKSLKAGLESQNKKQQSEKGKLLSLQSDLTDQKKITLDNKNQTTKLLTQTKNQESEYQKILASKQAAKDQFEKELYNLESQLKFILDPSSIPAKGSKVLAWPVNTVRITQYFGNTEFAKTAAYNGQGHNGIDFGVSTGTKVYAALSGKIVAVNTKVASMCQYGKWVLIQHDNGLTTLYAHLSLVSVNAGDKVATGQQIGYSGDTGYSTGPHLHLSVYASKAVELKNYTCKSGPTVPIPVAAFSGYLNPIDYFPSL